ncbi:gas vesicle protein GvpG [Mycobacterium sp. ITM-2016-00318]|uniref:gas vesicle protein GvpG n=1 Tax=Mycobacterium sp. ITM-2016-00318 TaxID=2099693 RepID=UPI000CF95C91|nr:gas vesicle protein GvpG [Mycobacterium sp. ITM-2016-00318]WNG93881.1 gas vesicle protein GvpG [Mycobacterium sp. ITM-2016-00318]
MGLFSAIAKLPLAPVYGVMSLAEVIQRQVEQELHNPANTRRQLEELEEARARGDVSPEEEREAQKDILETRVAPAQMDTQDES